MTLLSSCTPCKKYTSQVAPLGKCYHARRIPLLGMNLWSLPVSPNWSQWCRQPWFKALGGKLPMRMEPTSRAFYRCPFGRQTLCWFIDFWPTWQWGFRAFYPHYCWKNKRLAWWLFSFTIHHSCCWKRAQCQVRWLNGFIDRYFWYWVQNTICTFYNPKLLRLNICIPRGN